MTAKERGLDPPKAMFKSTRQINFLVRNTFFKHELIMVTMPYNPVKAMYGKYSELFKKMKTDFVKLENIDRHFIRIKFFKTMSDKQRIVIELRNGMKLDIPADVDEFDLLIIQKQLEVLKMPLYSDQQKLKALSA